ncbi:MAG: c-type cytochrome biogenesis protein CcmI [Burkholderiaceae bacterium]|jgi:cytochrome c-type biogenesis protein CcmH
MVIVVLAAIASVVLPLWRPTRGARLVAAETNLAVWREEREELLRDADNGGWSEAERQSALEDLSERAATELSGAAPTAAPPARPLRALALVLGASVLVLSGFLYFRLGSLDALSGQTASVAPQGQGASIGPNDPRVLAMVESLQKKLQANPDDMQGWILFARSQMVLEHYPEAARAYEQAVRLSPPDAQLLADYADALAMAQGRNLEGKPAEIVMQAIKVDPNNPKALELAGTVAVGRGDVKGALDYWGKLRQQLPADSEDAKEVDAALATLQARLDAGGAGPGTAAAPKGSDALATPAAPSASASVSGRVDLAPALAAKVTLSDTVYIFARTVDQSASGSRMPVAVLKFGARELPREFTLSDAQSMTPAAKLSAQKAVVIQARVTKSGQPLPQPGDLESAPQTVKPGVRGVTVIIDRVVP